MFSSLFLLTLPGLIAPAPKPPQAGRIELVMPAVNRTAARQTPAIQCGLVVYHVDASVDPKFVLQAPAWNLDPRIAVSPPAPCTKPK